MLQENNIILLLLSFFLSFFFSLWRMYNVFYCVYINMVRLKKVWLIGLLIVRFNSTLGRARFFIC
jgi:hypothetical protein